MLTALFLVEVILASRLGGKQTAINIRRRKEYTALTDFRNKSKKAETVKEEKRTWYRFSGELQRQAVVFLSPY